MKTATTRSILLACTLFGLATLAQELPTITPVAKTSYEAVTKYLNPGGSLYAYVSTQEWAAKLDQFVGSIEAMVVPNQLAPQTAGPQAAFRILHRLVTEGGLAELGGVGVSCVQTGEGLYHNRVVLQRTPAGAPGLYWQAFGGENGEFDLLKALPANTVLAAWTPCDAKLVWTWVRKAILDSGSEPLAAGFGQALQRWQAQGIALDTWMESLGHNVGLVLTVDPSKQFPFPGPGGKTLQVPGFALAILLEVRDDTVFKALDAKLPPVPAQDAQVGMPGLRLRPVPLPLPPPVRLTVAQFQDLLILSTSDELVLQLAAGKGGLTETPLFQKLAANMPKQGTGFSFLSPAFGDAMKQVMQASLAEAQANAGAPKFNAELLASLSGAGRAAYSVNVNTADGMVGLSNTTFDYGEALITQASIVPVAVMAGMLLPALNQSRNQARRVSDASNLKQIGLALRMWSGDNQEKFPDDLGLLMEKGYLTAGQVFTCPAATTPPPKDGAAVRAGQCDYLYFGKGRSEADCGTNDPIACTKPGLLGGQRVNVLYGDGHVMSHTFPPDNVQQLLAQAGISAPAAAAPAAPLNRGSSYEKVAGLTLAQTLVAKHPNARVLILAKSDLFRNGDNLYVSGLKEGLTGMTIVATVTLPLPEEDKAAIAAAQTNDQKIDALLQTSDRMHTWFTTAFVNKLTATYAGRVDLVISTAGLPEKDTANLWFWKDNVKIALANGPVLVFRQAIQDGHITAAVVYNPQAVFDQTPVPADPAAAFAKRFLLLTPETVAKIAAEQPKLFNP